MWGSGSEAPEEVQVATSSGTTTLAAPGDRLVAAPGPLHRAAWLSGADLVRSVATLLVIIIHCAPWPSHATSAASNFYQTMSLASRVSVPLFVVLSGLLLAHRHPRVTDPASFWARRLARTLLPWLVWAGVYFGLAVIFQGMSPDPRVTWGWWAGGAGHLYFLLLIPQFYLLYLIWPRGRVSSVVAAILAVVVQVGLQLARVMLHLGSWQAPLLLDFGFEEAPFWMGYFGIGVLLGLHPEWLAWRSRWALLGIPGFALSLVLVAAGLPGRAAVNWGPWVHGTGGFLRPSLLLLTVVALLGLWGLGSVRLQAAAGRTVRGFSRRSLGVYIMHPAFLMAAGPVLEVAPRPFSLQEPLPWSLIPFTVLVVVVGAAGWGATALLARGRGTAWVVGET